MANNYWAPKNQPSEIRGEVLEITNEKYKLSSFMLGRISYIDKKEFEEACIQYSLNIPIDVVLDAVDGQFPILFDPQAPKGHKFRLKDYSQ
jgi:hypothetical protein